MCMSLCKSVSLEDNDNTTDATMTDNVNSNEHDINKMKSENDTKDDIEDNEDSTQAQYNSDDIDHDEDQINQFLHDEQEEEEEEEEEEEDDINTNELQRDDIDDDDVDESMEEDEINHFHPNNNNNNNNTNNNGIFSYIGKMFKNKKNKKKNKKSNNKNNDDMNDDMNDDINDINSAINYNYNYHDNDNNNNNNNNNNEIGGDMIGFNGYTDSMYNEEYNNNSKQQQLSNLVGGDIPWNCEKCTFLNEPTELHCVICFYSRFEVKNLESQWQWKAADRWITYGIPETTEIENAYKNGSKEVSLTKGWFAQSPNLYKIYFDKEHGNKKRRKHDGKNKKKGNKHEYHDYDDNSTYFYQINSDSGTRREVRRIGTDDDKLFKKLILKSLDEKDRKCMICLHEFTENEESDGIIVQLSTCKNHGFHKQCIAQWVQLKGNCPLCRIDVDT